MGKERMSTPATDARGLSDWEEFKQSFEGRRTWRTRWRWASFYIWRRILGWLIILAFVLCTRCEMELRSTRRQRTICTQLPPLPLHSLSSFVLLHNIHILRTILVFFLKYCSWCLVLFIFWSPSVLQGYFSYIVHVDFSWAIFKFLCFSFCIWWIVDPVGMTCDRWFP